MTQMNYDKYEDGLRVIKKDDKDYEYRIVLNRSSSLWNITTSKGPVPQKLSGNYTSAGEAAKAIKNYQNIPQLKFEKRA